MISAKKEDYNLILEIADKDRGMSNSGLGEKKRGIDIAVKLDTSLHFERDDVKT